jgi:hypothetical protein
VVGVGLGVGIAMVARGGPQSVRGLVGLSERRGLGNIVWGLFLYEFRQIVLAPTPIARPVLLRPVFVQYCEPRRVI